MAAEPSSELPNGAAAAGQKKSKESDRRRRRRKQKKNKAPSDATADADAANAEAAEEENKPDSKPPVEIEVEYVAEEPDLADGLLADFKSIFDKFTFKDTPAAAEDGEKKDEAGADAAKKGSGSDSDDDEQDDKQKKKEGGISNKKKKLEQRMKIAELKQICNRPDVVEVWDATASDPKLLVYLKSYRNTVPVPRHWSQKRKFLQVVLGIGSFLVDPLCRMMGARLVWAISNFIVFVCMMATTILSWISSDLYSSKLQHIVGANKTVKNSALILFSLLGLPLSITYSVPFSVTAELTAGTGGGQGLATGVLNLAIVAPQIVVSLGAGPWDALFGGGNVPAFALASVFSLAAGVLAVLKLPKLSNNYQSAGFHVG